METKKREVRIARFEALFDQAVRAAADLEYALDAFNDCGDALAELAAYYDGGQWRRDYEADERGLLPARLKRGVLSQDGLWNLLERVALLRRRMGEASR